MAEVTPIYGKGILTAVVVAAATRARLDKEVGWHKSHDNGRDFASASFCLFPTT